MNNWSLILLIGLILISACLGEVQTSENQVNEFRDLYKNGTMIAVCDPSHCPAGRYANMVISNLELKEPENGKAIHENIATNDPNVRAVLDKVISREVDAGFVYLTDAYLEDKRVKIIEIPRAYSPLPQYGTAVINDEKNIDEARLFIKFITSKEGQEILTQYGFTPAIEGAKEFDVVNASKGKVLTVYAASSLTDVFTEVIKRFSNKTRVDVTVGYGSSGTLRQRIEGGAPSDVYATASLKHAEILIEGGFIDEYEVFARNHLVVVTAR
jgi:molybdate transport system substrate-binding protein